MDTSVQVKTWPEEDSIAVQVNTWPTEGTFVLEEKAVQVRQQEQLQSLPPTTNQAHQAPYSQDSETTSTIPEIPEIIEPEIEPVPLTRADIYAQELDQAIQDSLKNINDVEKALTEKARTEINRTSVVSKLFFSSFSY